MKTLELAEYFNKLVDEWCICDQQEVGSSAFKGATEYLDKDSGTIFKFLFAVEQSNVPHKKIYQILFGASLVIGGKSHVQAWYKSGSESRWRVFTGIRENGYWCKGAEGHGLRVAAGRGAIFRSEEGDLLNSEVLSTYTSMGYIMEGYVTSQLEVELSKTFDTWKNEAAQPNVTYKKFSLIPPVSIPVPTGQSNREKCYRNFFVCGYHNGFYPTIQARYDHARAYELVNLPLAIKQGSVNFVHNHQSIDVAKGYDVLGTLRLGEGHALKHDPALASWLTGCLNEPIGEVGYRRHELLECDVETRGFTLRPPSGAGYVHSSTPLIVFISNSVIRHDVRYCGYDLQGETILQASVPYCWVEHIEFEDVRTNRFGGAHRVPINLSFMIQKPIDYLHQTSEYNLKKLTVGFTRQPNGIIVANDPQHINIVGGEYIDLSLLNEATSSLIKAYKKHLQLPRVRHKYSKPKVYEFDDEYAIGYLKIPFLSGIMEYKHIFEGTLQRPYFNRHEHKYSGKSITRADNLITKVSLCENGQAIDTLLSETFCQNTVIAFFSGWPHVGTLPCSLFTCVMRNLLSFLSRGADHRYPILKGPLGDKYTDCSINLSGACPHIKGLIRWTEDHPAEQGMNNEEWWTAKSNELLAMLRSI